jgi:hypothetical protein
MHQQLELLAFYKNCFALLAAPLAQQQQQQCWRQRQL